MQLALSSKDKLVLQALEANSRQTLKEIGKTAGLSGEGVEYRLNKWRENGFVSKTFADPNLSKLGLKTYRLYLKMGNLSEKIEKKLQKEFLELPGIYWLAITSGQWDYLLRFTLKDETSFKKIIETILERYGQYIESKDFVISSYQTYCPATYLTGSSRASPSPDNAAELVDIDAIDRKILFYLYENSRIPTTKLASLLNISPDAVQYRLKKLISAGVIDKFSCWLDRSLLGYNYYKVFFTFQYFTPSEETEFLDYCKNHPNVVYINRVIGNWDIEVDFDAKNEEELYKMIKTMRNKFNKIIKSNYSLLIIKNYLVNPFEKTLDF